MFRVLPALLCLFAGIAEVSSGASFDLAGADEVRYGITKTPEGLNIRVLGAGVDRPGQAVFVAMRTGEQYGTPLLPAEKGMEGSAVWLPFQADVLLVAKSAGNGMQTFVRRWNKTHWGAREADGNNVFATVEPAQMLLHIPQKILGKAERLDLAVYMKDLTADGGMGRLYGAIDNSIVSGTGERTMRRYLSVETGKDGASFAKGSRISTFEPKIRIYQLLPRLFGNTNPSRVPNGTLAQNGSGKFKDLNKTALTEIKAMGFTHVLLTGVIRQATGTDYAALGLVADDPDVLKGVAGNTFAIRDYFDVSPDYADDPAKRLEEFKAMVGRIHKQGLKVLLDFEPNHVARNYRSVVKPELDFGGNDDQTKFFEPQNNFFYLGGAGMACSNAPPLRLPTIDGNGRPISPTAQALGKADGLFEAEKQFGRVTGNNLSSWEPEADSWYDTVKLNYGWNFADPASARHFPTATKPDLPIPDTWEKMDAVIGWWQGMGVDGFRADHASMVPPEFWRWLIARAMSRQSSVFFVANISGNKDFNVPDSDETVAAVTSGQAGLELLNAGFSAVEEPSVYEAVRSIYENGGSADDIDKHLPATFVFDNLVLFAENDATVRLAARSAWSGKGMAVGRAVSALIFGLSRGPVLLYYGQEVGEPAEDIEGFSGNDGRTTIYDYWSMPEFAKWVNDGKFDGELLSDKQRSLRDFYRRLLKVIDYPAFRSGDFYSLNPDNLENKNYGRVDDLPSGRWLYSYLRYEPESGQRMLVVVNLHPTAAMVDVRIRFSASAMRFLGWDALAGSKKAILAGADVLGDMPTEAAEWTATPWDMKNPGVLIKKIPPLTASYYELLSSANGSPTTSR